MNILEGVECGLDWTGHWSVNTAENVAAGVRIKVRFYMRFKVRFYMRFKVRS